MTDTKSLEENINQFIQLPENWDSYGAKRISAVAVKKAQAILQRAQR